MKLIRLGGVENDGVCNAACFSVDLCHCRVLLECPIDLSALLWFLPTVLPSKANVHLVTSVVESYPSNLKRSSVAGKVNYVETSNKSKDFDEVFQTGAKRSRLEAEKGTATSENSLQKKKGWGHHLKDIDGRLFLDATPYYKTPDFNLIDVTSVNAVIISNPVAMLGLPFLTRNPDFTAKIYATEATAKLGQLMMEELVALHMEFIQLYGNSAKSSIPTWQLPIFCAALLSHGTEQTNGSNGVGEKWHCLYSAVDIRACMARVHRLHYGEEANIDGFISVKPCSSGFGIGASNWVLKGANRSLSYVSSLVSATNHAMPLDISSLECSQVILFSHGDAVEISQDESSDMGKDIVGSKNIAEATVVEPNANEPHQANEGVAASKVSSQRKSLSPTSSVSLAPIGSLGPDILAQKSPSVHLPSTPEKPVKSATEENERPGVSKAMILDEQIGLICKAAVEALGGGGSVLIPTNFYGMFLELLEKMCTQLRSAGFETVPIYYISPVAQELLAYSNTVPEWLSPERQEKLYKGEPLFGFMDSIVEKRLHTLPALHSNDLLRSWQEPCVVFATHWSLRVGSAVHLLQRWRNNPHCLLVLTEPNVDQELLLAPFKPFSIQIIHSPLYTNFRAPEILSTIEKLKPQLSVIPENLKNLGALKGLEDMDLGQVLYHKVWKLLKIPSFQDKNNKEVEVSAGLALQIQLKQVKSGKVAAARLSAELHVKDGHWLLDTASRHTYHRDIPVSSLPKYQIRWGTIDVPSMLKALKDRGMSDFLVSERIDDDCESKEGSDSKVTVIEIKSPSQGNIELSSSRINVHANELSFRRLIVEVVNSVLNVL